MLHISVTNKWLRTKLCLHSYYIPQSLLKQQLEIASKWEGTVAQHITDIAALQSQNEELSERVQKLTSELEGLRLKDEAKTDQLKKIEEMTVGVPETMTSKMTIDEIKERFRTIHQWSTPGYLPQPQPETGAPPKKTSSSSGASKVTAKRRGSTFRPDTSDQKGVTLRGRPGNPASRGTSFPKKK